MQDAGDACSESHAKLYCLNGGSCFAIRVGGSSSSHSVSGLQPQLLACSCKIGFSGVRCELKYTEKGNKFKSLKRQHLNIQTQNENQTLESPPQQQQTSSLTLLASNKRLIYSEQAWRLKPSLVAPTDNNNNNNNNNNANSYNSGGIVSGGGQKAAHVRLQAPSASYQRFSTLKDTNNAAAINAPQQTLATASELAIAAFALTLIVIFAFYAFNRRFASAKRRVDETARAFQQLSVAASLDFAATAASFKRQQQLKLQQQRNQQERVVAMPESSTPSPLSVPRAHSSLDEQAFGSSTNASYEYEPFEYVRYVRTHLELERQRQQQQRQQYQQHSMTRRQ